KALKAKIISGPYKGTPGNINILTFKKPVTCFKYGQLNYIVAACKIRTNNPKTPLAPATTQRAKGKRLKVRYYGYKKLGHIQPACPKKSKISLPNSIPLFGHLSTGA
ncbi:hypothetical protein GGTG_11522, partial [Gaeumannomyces tritici R3-111a-1]